MTHRIGLQVLLATHVIILIDESKSIKRITEANFDPYMLAEKLRTSHLVMLPSSTSLILASQSQLYQPMCLLRDFRLTLTGLNTLKIRNPYARLSALPPLVI